MQPRLDGLSGWVRPMFVSSPQGIQRTDSSGRSTGVRGFTLVEMMVVVVIILLLAAVLLPSLRTARVRAMKTASQAQLKGLSNASENYYAAFNAYPGYFTDAQVDSTSAFTGNENFVISLMGLANPDNNPSNAFDPGLGTKVDLDKVGSGPYDKTTGKTYAPFYSAKAEELVVIEQAGGPINTMYDLVDPSSGMPLLMWRLKRTATVPVSASFGAGRLYMTAVTDYVDSPGLKKPGDDELFEQQGESLLNTSVGARLTNLAWAVIDPRSSTISVEPTTTVNDTNDVVNGAYVFISPGPDGIYFSKYDLKEDGTDTTINQRGDLSNFDDVIEVGGTN